MQTLHAEYSESCALFNAEKSLEGFQAYVAMVKGGVGGKQGGVKEEGGSPLDFLDKGRDHSDIEDEEEEGGAAEAGKKKKKKGSLSAFEAQLLRACHYEFGTLASDR